MERFRSRVSSIDLLSSGALLREGKNSVPRVELVFSSAFRRCEIRGKV
jgi:hypothetical protein